MWRVLGRFLAEAAPRHGREAERRGRV